MEGYQNPNAYLKLQLQDDPCNTQSLIHVEKRIVLAHDPETKSFRGKLTLKNQRCRYVTYVVRQAEAKKFKLKPRYGFIPPWETTEVEVIAEGVERFQEIAQDYFIVFAYPIRDKRQLEKKKLNMLWRAHGSGLLPFGESHLIPFILPKNDGYFEDIGLLRRIPIMSYLARLMPMLWCDSTPVVVEDKPVDIETFHLYWPIEDPISEDPSLTPILRDWHRVSKRILDQTQAVQQGFHVILAILITAGLTFFATSYLYLADAAPFCTMGSSEKAAPVVDIPPAQSVSWLSWLGFKQ